MNNTKDKNGKVVCRCEEVTEEEVHQCIADGCETLREIKLATRAGMGLCQGRICCKIISRILAEEIGKPLDEIKPAGYRPPLRLITLGTLANKQLKKM
jgi:NAD(P)H-nitrite reductase large subunit